MNSEYELLFLKALCTTVLVESAAVIGCVMVLPGIRKLNLSATKITAASILPSTLTLPYLWFILPAFFTQFLSRSIGGEIAIFIVEALIIKCILDIRLKYAALVSFCANSLSIIVGLFVFR